MYCWLILTLQKLLNESKMKSLQSQLNESRIASQENAKLIQKFQNDKLKLKGHLKITRENNQVLRNMVDELNKKVDDLKLENEVIQKQNEDSISNLEEFERERNATTWMNSVLLNLSELTCRGTNEKLLKTSMDEKEQCVKQAQDFAREGILSIMY